MDEPPFRKIERHARKSASSLLQLRRILVPIDFRDSTVATLRYAAAFAREYKATITLLHIVEPVGQELRRNISRERLIEELSQIGETQIRQLVDVIWGDEITTDVVVAGGKPYQQIVNEAKETNADMIIMARHGAVGSWGFFRRSTTAKVVRHAPCPVLVVPAFDRGLWSTLPWENTLIVKAQSIFTMRLGYSRKPDSSALPGQEALVSDPVDYAALGRPHFTVGLNPGDILDNRFLLAEIVSQGGMATIFKAQDLQDHNGAVAVKVPHLGIESNPVSFARFQREEEIGCRLNHPFILKFIPVTGTKSRPYIVTEYLRGCTLSHLLGRMRPLPEKDALKFASLICEALQYLHEHGVIHRDLKPSNLMICSEGRLRVMDFGISQSVESRRLTFVGFTTAMGTPDYIAPEQIKGRRGDQRSDIYSLGAVLYEMLTGAPPFEGDDPFIIMNTRMSGDPMAPRKSNPQLSPQAEEIVLRALQRDPSKRYPTAAAMKADLDAPDQMRLTGLCDRLQASTPWKRVLLLARHLFFIIVIPLAIQVLLFLWIWHHHTSKR